jgi:tetratricopeptide (TPR) repeat protein
MWRFATSIAIELQSIGRYRDAVRWAQRGAALAPGDWRPLCRLAAALCNADRSEEARPLLERLAKGRCHEAWVLMKLGKVLFHSGDHQAASVHLAKYLRRCPSDVQARQHLVAAAEHLGNHRWANRQAFRVVDESSSNPQDQFDVGTRYIELQVPRFAIGHLALAAEHDPLDARIWCNLAWAELQIGRWGHAGYAAKQAVERDPKDPMGWCNLGDAAWALGHLDDAVDAYTTAVRVDRKRRTQARSRLKAALAERKRPTSKPVRRMT